jgi:hypothetical protein
MPRFRKSGLRTKESFAAGLKLGLSDFITSSPHSELGRADERKRHLHCVAKLQRHSSTASMKLSLGRWRANAVLLLHR